MTDYNDVWNKLSPDEQKVVALHYQDIENKFDVLTTEVDELKDSTLKIFDKYRRNRGFAIGSTIAAGLAAVLLGYTTLKGSNGYAHPNSVNISAGHNQDLRGFDVEGVTPVKVASRIEEVSEEVSPVKEVSEEVSPVKEVHVEEVPVAVSGDPAKKECEANCGAIPRDYQTSERELKKLTAKKNIIERAITQFRRARNYICSTSDTELCRNTNSELTTTQNELTALENRLMAAENQFSTNKSEQREYNELYRRALSGKMSSTEAMRYDVDRFGQTLAKYTQVREEKDALKEEINTQRRNIKSKGRLLSILEINPRLTSIAQRTGDELEIAKDNLVDLLDNYSIAEQDVKKLEIDMNYCMRQIRGISMGKRIKKTPGTLISTGTVLPLQPETPPEAVLPLQPEIPSAEPAQSTEEAYKLSDRVIHLGDGSAGTIRSQDYMLEGIATEYHRDFFNCNWKGCPDSVEYENHVKQKPYKNSVNQSKRKSELDGVYVVVPEGVDTNNLEVVIEEKSDKKEGMSTYDIVLRERVPAHERTTQTDNTTLIEQMPETRKTYINPKILDLSGY